MVIKIVLGYFDHILFHVLFFKVTCTQHSAHGIFRLVAASTGLEGLTVEGIGKSSLLPDRESSIFFPTP